MTIPAPPVDAVPCPACGHGVPRRELLVWPDRIGSAICRSCRQIVLVSLQPEQRQEVGNHD